MTQLRPSEIASRMADHYARQIAWVEESIRALEQLNALSVDADWDEFAAGDVRRAAEMSALEAEFFALKNEWDATPAFLPEERNRVRALVMRFKSLSSEFHQKLEALLRKFAAEGYAMRGELGTLRKALDVVQKFASGLPHGGGIVDRRA